MKQSILILFKHHASKQQVFLTFELKIFFAIRVVIFDKISYQILKGAIREEKTPKIVKESSSSNSQLIVSIFRV